MTPIEICIRDSIRVRLTYLIIALAKRNERARRLEKATEAMFDPVQPELFPGKWIDDGRGDGLPGLATRTCFDSFFKKEWAEERKIDRWKASGRQIWAVLPRNDSPQARVDNWRRNMGVRGRYRRFR